MMLCFVGWLLLYVVIGFAGAGDKQKNKKKIREKKTKRYEQKRKQKKNTEMDNWVVVSNIFYFHPYLGKIPILTSIFFKGVGSTTN